MSKVTRNPPVPSPSGAVERAGSARVGLGRLFTIGPGAGAPRQARVAQAVGPARGGLFHTAQGHRSESVVPRLAAPTDSGRKPGSPRRRGGSTGLRHGPCAEPPPRRSLGTGARRLRASSRASRIRISRESVVETWRGRCMGASHFGGGDRCGPPSRGRRTNRRPKGAGAGDWDAIDWCQCGNDPVMGRCTNRAAPHWPRDHDSEADAAHRVGP